MLHAYMFTLSGIPVLYSGDEIGQENDYGYHNDPLKADDSRWLHRGAMQWDKAELRHDPDTVEGRIFTALGRLETLRRAHRCFDSHADTWLVDTADDSVLGLGRYYDGEKLIALFNFGDQTKTVWTDQTEDFTDLLTGERRKAQGVALAPGGFVWLACDFDKEG